MSHSDILGAIGVPTRLLSDATARPAARRPSLFARRDFNDEALRRPAEPVFHQLDLVATRNEGFSEGYAAGVAEAEASRATLQVHTLERIATAMAEGREEAARVADAAASAVADMLVAALQAVMPDLIHRSSLTETNAMLAHVLPGLAREPEVHIQVPNDIVADIANAVASLDTEYRDRIRVAGLENMEPGATLVRWRSGQAWRQPAQVWQTIMAALDQALEAANVGNSNHGK